MPQSIRGCKSPSAVAQTTNGCRTYPREPKKGAQFQYQYVGLPCLFIPDSKPCTTDWYRVAETAKKPEVIKKLEGLGLTSEYKNPSGCSALIEEQWKSISVLIKENGAEGELKWVPGKLYSGADNRCFSRKSFLTVSSAAWREPCRGPAGHRSDGNGGPSASTTFHLNPISAVIMLAGIQLWAAYGGVTTSILVNVPGEASSVVTCLDGTSWLEKGRAGPALGMRAFRSFIAGTLSIVGVMFLAPNLQGSVWHLVPRIFFSDAIRH